MGYKRFEDLPAWQIACNLEQRIGAVTSRPEFKMDWDLRTQLRRAAASMMSNVAEGFSRRSDREFVQFLFVAKASAAELQSYLYVVLNRGYLNAEEFRALYALADEFARQASGLIRYLMGRNAGKKRMSPS